MYLNIDFMDPVQGLPSKPDGYYDLTIFDPPYGRGEHGGTNRTKKVLQRNGSSILVPDGGYSKKGWDGQPMSLEMLNEVKRVSNRLIMWGVNYMPGEWQGGRIIWDKVNDGADQSGAEIAYCSINSRVDIFRFMWRGMMQGKSATEGTVQKGDKRKNQKRIHPTEKPYELYEHLLLKYAQPGWRVLDPCVGSASSLVVFERFGFEYDAYEIDPEYYQSGMDRLEAHRRLNNSLFTPQQLFENMKRG